MAVASAAYAIICISLQTEPHHPLISQFLQAKCSPEAQQSTVNALKAISYTYKMILKAKNAVPFTTPVLAGGEG